MGINWYVFAIEGEFKAHLDTIGIPYPSIPSRLPTGREISASLRTLPDCTADEYNKGVGHRYCAYIDATDADHEGTLLVISHYGGDDEPQNLWFEKGSERIVVKVLTEIAKRCGPLAFICDVITDVTIVQAPEPDLLI
jgi:hypothetical protein